MCGKLMQVSDELMWRYWTLLTDLSQGEIAAMRVDVEAGTLHPMDAKKAMARTITAGFSSDEAALRAEENWATQFQKGGVSEDTARVTLQRAEVAWNDANSTVSTDKLAVGAKLAASMSEARRKRAEGAIKMNDRTASEQFEPVPVLPVTLTVKLGKKTKLVTIE